MSHACPFAVLIGETVTRVLVDDIQQRLVFETAAGRSHVFRTEVDCCNDVWFNHLGGLDALLGEAVVSTEENGWIDVAPTRQESDAAGFWTIATARGRCVIEVRNSSNGYYGGNVAYAGTYPLEDARVVEDDF